MRPDRLVAGQLQEPGASSAIQTARKREPSTNRSSATIDKANKAQAEQTKAHLDKSAEEEAAEQEEPDVQNREDLQHTDHGLAASGVSGPAGAAGEAKDKKPKVKKFNKKELKKKEARLKREQELAENTKRMEILQ